MFTGIVEGRGTLTRLERIGERVDLQIRLDAVLCEGVAMGDSVAIDGCCLTVVEVLPGAAGSASGLLGFQAVPETLDHTALGDLTEGDPVNVERALRATDRLGGHIVQGHVDGTGVVRELRREGEDTRMRVDCTPEVAAQLVHKGSVAVSGVSLTVVEPDETGFSVALIPHTLAATTLGERKVGQRVNLEVDVLGKYVFQYLKNRGMIGDRAWRQRP